MINRLHRHARRSLRQRSLFVCLAAGSLLVGAGGCGEDTTGPAPLTSAQTFWAVRLNYHAVNMALTAPYDTVQLTATAVNALGDALPDIGMTITYTAGDSIVSVSPTGLVTANFQTAGITSVAFVVAKATDSLHHLTLTDTAFIQVTATPPSAPLATFSIQPVGGDSAKRGIYNFPYTLNVTATNTLGAPVNFISGSDALLASLVSSNPNIAKIDRSSGTVSAAQPGLVTFSATTLAYGVAMQDSLRFIVGYETRAAVKVVQVSSESSVGTTAGFEPASVTVGQNGIVRWQVATTGDPIDIVFDDPTAVQAGDCYQQDCTTYPSPDPNGGNIAQWAFDTTAFNLYRQTSDFAQLVIASNSVERRRKFPVVGTYRYHSTLHPQETGRVIVLADPR